jgi:hypothetical protein
MKLKKLLILLSVVSLTLTACGNDDPQLSTDTTTETVSEPTEESNPDYDKQPEDYLPDNLKDIENKTEEEIEIILKKGYTIIEQYEELQDAAQSDWLVIYCAAKKKLIDLIYKYYNEHKDTTELAAAWITRDLYKDWTDLKCQYWTQK